MNLHSITTWLSNMYCTCQTEVVGNERGFLVQKSHLQAFPPAVQYWGWEMVSVVTNDSWFKRTGVLLDSKWRSAFPLNGSHFLCSPCAQTTVFSLCLRSLKCPFFLLLDRSSGITKEKQLPYYCHLPSVSVFLLLPSTVLVALISKKACLYGEEWDERLFYRAC